MNTEARLAGDQVRLIRAWLSRYCSSLPTAAEPNLKSSLISGRRWGLAPTSTTFSTFDAV